MNDNSISARVYFVQTSGVCLLQSTWGLETSHSQEEEISRFSKQFALGIYNVI